ncbi:mercuric transporter MerT family protein [Ramlibacter alkalitolerans]|uniref:Mercuric transport protein MerT n=1 Tax=Ramlibacter alkalitolerans TaxID=2039631 RepID=A0ABS1JHI9_9BURK|nr:mercuric transporter MerT family protein [Ramlibacter alkalitolerans]MBL0423679.1 mercuric transport protein [Ramlibacter alkalitolerans]
MQTSSGPGPQQPSPLTGSAPAALTLAGIAALLSSACCVVPLVFAIVGISGAWIGQLRVLEPWSGVLSALALAALGTAGWRLYRPAADAACDTRDPAACRRVGSTARRWFWLVAVLTLIPLLVPLAAPLFY